MLANDSDTYEELPSSSFPDEKENEGESKENPFVPASETKTNKKSKTPVLDNFGRDVTALAEKNGLDPVVGREKEIERVSKKSYIVLASGENDKERNKFYKWTLIGTSILLKKEWKTLFKKIKFKGDYYFSSAKSLGV